MMQQGIQNIQKAVNDYISSLAGPLQELNQNVSTMATDQ